MDKASQKATRYSYLSQNKSLMFCCLKQECRLPSRDLSFLSCGFLPFGHTKVKQYNPAGELWQIFRALLINHIKHTPKIRSTLERQRFHLKWDCSHLLPPPHLPPRHSPHTFYTLTFWTSALTWNSIIELLFTEDAERRRSLNQRLL